MKIYRLEYEQDTAVGWLKVNMQAENLADLQRVAHYRSFIRNLKYFEADIEWKEITNDRA